MIADDFLQCDVVAIVGAGASHELIKHLLGMSSPRKAVLFTCGWMIMDADEAAIMQLPEDAWKPGITQDGDIEEDKEGHAPDALTEGTISPGGGLLPGGHLR